MEVSGKINNLGALPPGQKLLSTYLIGWLAPDCRNSCGGGKGPVSAVV